MKLATLRSARRDGTLALVSRDLGRAVKVPEIAPTFQAAIDDWDMLAPRLQAVYERLNKGEVPEAAPFDPAQAAAPLPRAYQWCDASVFIAHHERMSKWLKKPVTKEQLEAPLIYQGGSDFFLGAMEPIRCFNEDWAIDFEAELAVITTDVPMGATPAQAGKRIRLMMIANDVSLRNVAIAEIARGFGVYLGKPASSFSPVAVTLDELGEAWDGEKLRLPVITKFRGAVFGRPNAGVDKHFGFPDIIAHAAKTRDLCAGSIFGSGTVANRDESLGTSCIADKRAMEILATGEAKTDYMHFGDSVRIEVFGDDGQSIFGAIDQKVTRADYPKA